MRYENIADIYSANLKVRAALTATVGNISPTEATVLADGEKWTIQQIVEHLSMVDFGISRICAKLLEAARSLGKPGDGTVKLSTDFLEKSAVVDSVKIEAPERVQPSGNVPIAESLDKMNANRPVFDALRATLEKHDVSEPKFPHPYFGDITATEWMVVAVGHEQRHTKQIERLLAKIRQ
jgi:hypothetical protein